MPTLMPAAEPFGSLLFDLEWHLHLVSGPGKLAALPQVLSRRGWQRVFVVLDPALAGAGLAERVRQLLAGSGAERQPAGLDAVGLFTGAQPDAGLAGIGALQEAIRAAAPDVVVTIGGGSTLDTAKAALVGAAGAQLIPYSPPTAPTVPHVAIPTTAGTGSEVSPAAVVHDARTGRKHVLRDRALWPTIALLDPELTCSMPPPVTAATAMDALSHATESIVATLRNPLTEALALQAARMIARAAPAVMTNGADIGARGCQQIGATLAGLSMCGGLGAAHALSHALGGRHRVPHGVANGIFLPPVIRFNARHGADYRALASAFSWGEPASRDEGALEAAEALAGAIESFRSHLGLPGRLREADVPRGALAELVPAALDDLCLPMNPAPLTAGDVFALIKAAW